MKIQVWSEGYSATGQNGKAEFFGEVEAEDFKSACDKICSSKVWQSKNGNYNPEQLTVWRCRLYDNEKDARRSFG